MNRILVLVIVFVISNADEVHKKKVKTEKIVIPDYLTIVGTRKETAWTKQRYLSFNDVRYANPIDESNRFLPPSSYEPSGKEGLDIVQESRICPSLNSDEDADEDCLVVDIATKNISGSLPVLVHLASFDLVKEEGSNDISDPGFLLEQDVVVVSVQYRLGPFGFLSTATSEIPGNVGILDVIEALRWIQKYISHFGGDPKSVTLFGQYHSAAIINILTMTPLLEKEELFHKVIYQSGSALLPDLINKEPKDMMKYMAKELRMDSEDISDINQGFKESKTRDILKAYKSYVDSFDDDPVSLVVIGDLNGVLPEEPKVLLKKRKQRAYPTIGGVVEQPSTCVHESDFSKRKPLEKSKTTESRDSEDSDEVTSRREKSSNNTKIDEDIAQIADILRDVLILEIPSNGEQAEYIHNLFPKKIFATNFVRGIAPTVMDMYSVPIKEATLQALKHNTAKGGKSYLYAFNYNPSESRLSCGEDVYVVQLTDDDMFLFPQQNEGLKDLTARDTRVARLMVELWTSFAKTGEPKAHSLHDWPPIKLGLNGPYFIIDTIHKLGYDYTEEYFSGLRAQRNNIEIVDL